MTNQIIQRNSSVLIAEQAIYLLPSLAICVGDREAMFLQQLQFWLNNKKIGKEIDGRKWIFNTTEEWLRDNFPFWTRDRLARIITNLVEDGIVLRRSDLNQRVADRTWWYTINYNKLNEVVLNGGQVERIAKQRESLASNFPKKKTPSKMLGDDLAKCYAPPLAECQIITQQNASIPYYTSNYSGTNNTTRDSQKGTLPPFSQHITTQLSGVDNGQLNEQALSTQISQCNDLLQLAKVTSYVKESEWLLTGQRASLFEEMEKARIRIMDNEQQGNESNGQGYMTPRQEREHMDQTLAKFEHKYGMSSQEFYAKWLTGEFPDTFDGNVWSMMFEPVVRKGLFQDETIGTQKENVAMAQDETLDQHNEEMMIVQQEAIKVLKLKQGVEDSDLLDKLCYCIARMDTSRRDEHNRMVNSIHQWLGRHTDRYWLAYMTVGNNGVFFGGCNGSYGIHIFVPMSEEAITKFRQNNTIAKDEATTTTNAQGNDYLMATPEQMAQVNSGKGKSAIANMPNVFGTQDLSHYFAVKDKIDKCDDLLFLAQLTGEVMEASDIEFSDKVFLYKIIEETRLYLLKKDHLPAPGNMMQDHVVSVNKMVDMADGYRTLPTVSGIDMASGQDKTVIAIYENGVLVSSKTVPSNLVESSRIMQLVKQYEPTVMPALPSPATASPLPLGFAMPLQNTPITAINASNQQTRILAHPSTVLGDSSKPKRVAKTVSEPKVAKPDLAQDFLKRWCEEVLCYGKRDETTGVYDQATYAIPWAREKRTVKALLTKDVDIDVKFNDLAACYRQMKQKQYCQDRHVFIQEVANNLQAWIAAGRPSGMAVPKWQAEKEQREAKRDETSALWDELVHLTGGVDSQGNKHSMMYGRTQGKEAKAMMSAGLKAVVERMSQGGMYSTIMDMDATGMEISFRNAVKRVIKE
jgi:hypothetical protein